MESFRFPMEFLTPEAEHLPVASNIVLVKPSDHLGTHQKPPPHSCEDLFLAFRNLFCVFSKFFRGSIQQDFLPACFDLTINSSLAHQICGCFYTLSSLVITFCFPHPLNHLPNPLLAFLSTGYSCRWYRAGGGGLSLYHSSPERKSFNIWFRFTEITTDVYLVLYGTRHSNP